MSISILDVPTWSSSFLALMFGPGPLPSPNNCSNACLWELFSWHHPFNWELGKGRQLPELENHLEALLDTLPVLGTFFHTSILASICSAVTCLQHDCYLPFWALETDRALVFLVFLALVLGTQSVFGNYLAVPREWGWFDLCCLLPWSRTFSISHFLRIKSKLPNIAFKVLSVCFLI